jgi:fumarate hydratase class II
LRERRPPRDVSSGIAKLAGRRYRKHAPDNDLTVRQAALKLGFVTEEAFDRAVDPAKMVHPYVATGS